MKTLQYFSDVYLEQWRTATPEEILQYLESFRLMDVVLAESKLISTKIPVALHHERNHPPGIEVHYSRVSYARKQQGEYM